MAKSMIIKVVVDPTEAKRGLTEASAATAKFERDIGKATRGAAAGSGVFQSMGRSLAFASGGFVAFASVSEFLRSSIDAAREAAVSQRALAAQMKASGQSFQANSGQIDEVARSYAKFGFQNDEVIASLTVLERGTGSISKALRLQMLVADLARAKNMRLADAAAVVAKVFGGQETALRRAVPGLARNAHGIDLITLAQQRLRGQAAANTTVAERFQATLHDTQEIIGTALLPTLNLYLTKLSDWMSKTQNQEKIQKAANTAAKDGATAFGDLAGAVGLAAKAYGMYRDAVSHLPGGKGGSAQLLFGNLFDQVKAEARRARQIMDYFSGFGRGDFAIGAKGAPGGGDFGVAGIRGHAPREPFSPADAAAARRRRRPSLQGRFNLDELRLAQARVTGDLPEQRRILAAEAIILKAQAAHAKTLPDRTKYTQQLASVEDQIRSLDQQSAAAAKKLVDAKKKQRDSYSIPLRLQLAEARANALAPAGAQGLDKEQIAILGKEKVAIKAALKSGNLGIQGAIQAWDELKSVTDQLGQGGSAAGVKGSYRVATIAGLTRGLGPAARKAMEGRLAQAAEHRGYIPAGPAAQGQVVITGPVHVHGVQDVEKLWSELDKIARRRHQRRGGR